MTKQQKQDKFLYELDQLFNPQFNDVVDDLKEEMLHKLHVAKMAQMLNKTLNWLTNTETKHFNPKDNTDDNNNTK